MNKKLPKPTTKARTVRLPMSHWDKFTQLMKHYGGRVWLEKAIDKEFKRMDSAK